LALVETPALRNLCAMSAVRSRPTRPLHRSALPLAALAVLLAADATDAEVFRYKDERGNWVYADRPPASGPAESVRTRSETTSPRIVVEPRAAGGSLEMVAVNECRCPVEFAIKVKGADGAERVAQAVVPERSQKLLIEVPTPPGTGRFAFDYGYVIGDPGSAHAPTQPYRAPFAPAQTFTVSQAPPTAVTHGDLASRYAVDIAMPVGTAVHAARGGLVINVAHKFFASGLKPQLGDEANFVQILHDDGTTAIYAHLQMDTIRVRPGQRVERGQYIANSGNTGFSSGPHLHFVVVRNAGFRSESVPVAFAGPGGSSVTARTGQPLTAY
jgi:murein DD-endopeptidase MepM/ murein hydrolase activator NlpD